MGWRGILPPIIMLNRNLHKLTQLLITMDAIEKCMLRDVAHRMSLERNKYARTNPTYIRLDNFIKDILNVVEPNPENQRKLKYDHEKIIDWISSRPSLNMANLARYIEYDKNTLVGCVNRQKYKGGKYIRKIPKNKIPKVVEWLAMYGYDKEFEMDMEAWS